MLFNSFEFLIFLALTFILYWLVCRNRKEQNVLLLVASYVFYGWWDYRFPAFIVAITAASYASGLILERYQNRNKIKKLVLWGMSIFTIGTLWIFKYFNFFIEQFSKIISYIGFQTNPFVLDILVPIGISFYSFQALSYTIDVSRGTIKAEKSPLIFSVFISFFPQLLAGPIERASNLIPQFKRDRKFNYDMGVSGMKLILWGLFKKMVVADSAGAIVTRVFTEYQEIGTLNLWIGGILCAFQIYADFSGYSDMAVGVGRLFGIGITRNFDKPFLSRDIREYWRRWHISLNSWFLDYIYIPLGGNRKGKFRLYLNIFIIFLISGIWHGANYTYICWGIYCALIIILTNILGLSKKRSEIVAKNRILPSFSESLMMGFTFFLMMFGHVMVRSPYLYLGFEYISLMFSNFTPSSYIGEGPALFWAAAMMALEWAGRRKENPIEFSGHGLMRYKYARRTFYLVMFMACLLFTGTQTNFIYFKF